MEFDIGMDIKELGIILIVLATVVLLAVFDGVSGDSAVGVIMAAMGYGFGRYVSGGNNGNNGNNGGNITNGSSNTN